jgi:peptide methionine sulfoxide reductase msrA/msrB
MKKIMLYALALVLLAGAAYAWFVPRSVDKEIPNVSAEASATATFAGGCFWCTEADFEKLDGVIEAVSGYMGGKAETATYQQTSNKTTDHREVVQVKYNTNKLSFKELADYHLRHIDPTDNEGQFVDRGYVYSPAIFYENQSEQAAAQQALAALNQMEVFDTEVQIPIEPAKPFYKAEEYHQDYYLKNPVRYKFYRNGSGRTEFLEDTWNN